MGFEVRLDVFEGPVDILYYEAKKNRVDIALLSLSEIARQFMAYLEISDIVDIDIGADFIEAASRLIRMKSSAVLPLPVFDDEDDEDDFDFEESLLVYAKYFEAAQHLGMMPLLDKDVFTKGINETYKPDNMQEQEINVGLFELLNAFKKLLSEKSDMPAMEIRTEAISLRQRMSEVLDICKGGMDTPFTTLFQAINTRRMFVYTFLALLELIKTGFLAPFEREGEIYLKAFH